MGHVEGLTVSQNAPGDPCKLIPQGGRRFVPVQARTVDELQAAVGKALQSFTPTKCMNYFAASGYDAV
jgi:hypothetical protein